MNIRIYQVNMKRDTNNVAFMGYELLEKLQGSQAVNAKIYDKVFDGEVDCQTLEDVYQMFNLNHPEGYKDRSLSVSDVVEVMEDYLSKQTVFTPIGQKTVNRLLGVAPNTPIRKDFLYDRIYLIHRRTFAWRLYRRCLYVLPANQPTLQN